VQFEGKSPAIPACVKLQNFNFKIYIQQITFKMKAKILTALLIISSLFGHLEWGQNNQMFLFQAEAEIVTKIFTDPLSVLHPFTVLPLVGQLLLLVTLFQKKQSKLLVYMGITGIGILLALMFFIGIIDLNFSILLSTTPFLVVAFLTIRQLRKKKVSEVPGL
jgi:hypothetical protein